MPHHMAVAEGRSWEFSKATQRQGNTAAWRTLAPLGVQLQHFVHQRHIGVPPPLALSHQLRVATALWRGLGCEVVSMEDGMVADAHQEQRGGTSLATERILVKLPQVKKPKWLPVACPVCGPAFPIRLGADCMPVTSDPGRPTNAARAASPLLTAGEVQAHQEAGLAQRVSYVGEQ